MSENVSSIKGDYYLKMLEIKCGYCDTSTWRWYASDPFGGVGFHVRFKNCAEKTIKYVTFTVIPKNAVSDAAEQPTQLKYVGPLEPGRSMPGFVSWEGLWYNNTITTAHIENVRIEYMDGSIVELNAESLNSTEGDSKDIGRTVGLVGVGIIILILIFIFAQEISSSSSSYSNTYNNQRYYDRHYDNDEIKDFVNNYDGKW